MEDLIQKGQEVATTGADAVAQGGIPHGSALVVDILVLCFLLLFALIGAKKGLYNTFMPLVVVVLALTVGIVGSRALVPVAHNLFYEKIETQVVEKFDNSVEAAMEGVNTPKKEFQKQWNNLLEGVGIATKPVEEQVTEPKLVSEAREALKAKTEKAFNIFAAWVLFGICTAIGFLLLTLVKNLLGEVADWPVIKWVDGLGGLAVGLLTGMLVFFIIVKACGIFGIDFFTQYEEGTTLLKMFTKTF